MTESRIYGYTGKCDSTMKKVGSEPQRQIRTTMNQLNVSASSYGIRTVNMQVVQSRILGCTISGHHKTPLKLSDTAVLHRETLVCTDEM